MISIAWMIWKDSFKKIVKIDLMQVQCQILLLHLLIHNHSILVISPQQIRKIIILEILKVSKRERREEVIDVINQQLLEMQLLLLPSVTTLHQHGQMKKINLLLNIKLQVLMKSLLLNLPQVWIWSSWKEIKIEY